jgi:hypothetical protein
LSNDEYWGGPPAIKRLEVVRYVSASAVKDALLSGELDIVWGAGVLSNEDIFEIQNSDEHRKTINVFHSDDVQNVILLLNTGKPPLNDINVRKTIIHSINKAAIVANELKGLDQVVDNVFPLQAPYCDVDLTPRWDYDLEKAVLLSCGGDGSQGLSSSSSSSTNQDEKDNTAAFGLGIGLGCLFVVSMIVAGILYKKNKALEEKLSLTVKEGAVDA